MSTRGNAKHNGAGLTSLLCALSLVASVSHAQPAPTVPSVPAWALSGWSEVATSYQLRRSQQVTPSLLVGDFDGDGTRDVAILVLQISTQKSGIVFLHQRRRIAYVVGAGHTLGNGGDDFRWMDSWQLVTRTSKGPRADAVLVERESSASGVISFARGRYRWRQVGD